MSKFNENVFPGAVFGMLTIVERIPHSGGRAICKCACGKTTSPKIASLVNGRSKSCGCSSKAKPGKGYGKVIPGYRFGRLSVIKRLKMNGRFTGQVKCLCDCGRVSKHGIDGLIYKKIVSCGCFNRETTINRNKETAKFKRFSAKCPRTYITWHSMIARCSNKNQKSYEKYGATGVIVCEFLKKSPRNLAKIIGVKKNKKLTIDRFPIHNGNYTCGQCKQCKQNGWELNIRWATRKQQSENRGDFNVHLTAFGKTMLLSQWAEELKMDARRITDRIKRGWPVEKALA